MVVKDVVERVDGVVESFDGVVDPGGSEKDYVGFLIDVDVGYFPFRSGGEFVDGECVGDGGDVGIGHQAALPGALFKPVADGDEVDGDGGIEFLFLVPYLAGEVVGVAASGEKLAVAAVVVVVGALVGVVANSGHGPHVVERPHDFFPHLVEFPDAAERHEPLVYPVEAHDVGLLNPRVAVDIDREVTCRDLEQVAVVKAVGGVNLGAFKAEGATADEACRHCGDRGVAACLGVDKHFHVEALAFQRLHEAEGHDGCPSEGVAVVYKQDFFACKGCREMIGCGWGHFFFVGDFFVMVSEGSFTEFPMSTIDTERSRSRA